MVKAIRLRDVLPQDVVCKRAEEPLEIERVLSFSNTTGLFIRDYPSVIKLEDKHETIIGLLHRPYPQGKTESDMRMQIGMCALHVAPGKGQASSPEVLRENITKLREAIEAWELGRPLE